MTADDVIRGLILIVASVAALGSIPDLGESGFVGFLLVVSFLSLVVGFVYTVGHLVSTIARWWDRNTD